jgi:hypothetical protein
VLLCLLLGGAVLVARRFVAPEHRPFVVGAALLLLGAYVAFCLAQLRRFARQASLWSEAARRSREFRVACADFARELPDGVLWSSKRGLLEGAATLTPETREHLAYAARRFERALHEQAWAARDSATGEVLVRRSEDHWQLLWRGEGAEARLHSHGPLSEGTHA